MTELDPVERLLHSELDEWANQVLVIDAPTLAKTLGVGRARAWCDDWAQHHQLDPELALDPVDVLTGMHGNQLVADVVLAKIPKSLAELDQLCGLASRAGANLLAGARIKYLTFSMNSVIGRHYDAASASLGVSKSRVLRGIGPSPVANEWPKERHHDDLGLWLAAHGGTFGGTKIDQGTRLLIDKLDQVCGDRVVDLGCGNGTLAVLAAKAGRQVIATDSSAAAVAATTASAGLNQVDFDTIWADGLAGIDDASTDAIVCNPPFHQGRTKESSPTLEMFTDAARVLVPGGEFWCVFNSHLPWRKELNLRLGPTQVITQNPHYTLTRTVVR